MTRPVKWSDAVSETFANYTQRFLGNALHHTGGEQERRVND